MASQNVKIEGATKVYGDFKACDHISLDIREGEFFTLLGPSGCAIVKDCKNPLSAQKFIDYLSSAEVQSQLGALNRRSVRTDVEDPDTMTAWEDISFVDMDIDWTSSHTEEFNGKWQDYVTQ